MSTKQQKKIQKLSNTFPLKSQVFFKFAEGNLGWYKRQLPIVEKFFEAMKSDKLTPTK